MVPQCHSHHVLLHTLYVILIDNGLSKSKSLNLYQKVCKIFLVPRLKILIDSAIKKMSLLFRKYRVYLYETLTVGYRTISHALRRFFLLDNNVFQVSLELLKKVILIRCTSQWTGQALRAVLLSYSWQYHHCTNHHCLDKQPSTKDWCVCRKSHCGLQYLSRIAFSILWYCRYC